MWENEEWWQNKKRRKNKPPLTGQRETWRKARGGERGETLKKDQISPIAAWAQGEKLRFGFFFGLFVLGRMVDWEKSMEPGQSDDEGSGEGNKQSVQLMEGGMHDHFCENVLPSQRLEA